MRSCNHPLLMPQLLVITRCLLVVVGTNTCLVLLIFMENEHWILIELVETKEKISVSNVYGLVLYGSKAYFWQSFGMLCDQPCTIVDGDVNFTFLQRT